MKKNFDEILRNLNGYISIEDFDQLISEGGKYISDISGDYEYEIISDYIDRFSKLKLDGVIIKDNILYLKVSSENLSVEDYLSNLQYLLLGIRISLNITKSYSVSSLLYNTLNDKYVSVLTFNLQNHE